MLVLKLKFLFEEFLKTPIREFLVFIITFSVCFPFIPSIITGSDTQPLLIILVLIIILVFILWPKFLEAYKNRNVSILRTISFIFLITLLSIFLNSFLLNKPVIFSRFASFIQFLFALSFAYLGSMKYFSKYLNSVFWIYLLFTIVYFSTNGLVETLLIKSRDPGTSSLLALTGRGARTLSPEPAFFANQLFNLLLILLLLKERQLLNQNINYRITWIILVVCLLSTLSGYGFLIIAFVGIIYFFKIFLGVSILLLLSSPIWLRSLEDYAQFRAIRLIFRVLTENPAIVLRTDSSIATRISSFLSYIKSFGDNLLFGDGFSLLQTGGLISIVSSIGLAGLLILSISLWRIFNTISDNHLKFLLMFWFFLNLLAGPIGIPTIGIIIGLILRPNGSLNQQG